MSVDPSVVAALEAALTADPDASGVRAHLAALLVEAGRPEDALEHCRRLLAERPDDVSVLRTAEAAARAAGQSSQADSYARLLTALGGAAQPGSEEPRDVRFPRPGQAAGDDDAVDRQDGGTADAEPPAERGDDAAPKGIRVVQATSRFTGDQDDTFLQEPDLTLDDVAGLEHVKRRLHVSFLGPLRNPELRRAYGKSVRGGLLLYGPPGCGKTFVARATAGELGARFLSVGLTDVLDMWLGQSEAKLHELFEIARRNAPTVIFFDELDALGHARSSMVGHAGRNVVNVLLSEMDGIDTSNEGVFCLAATNQPWDVDAALRRPGRFDRVLLVLPPDEPARRAILERHARERQLEGVDLTGIARKTEGFSGADLVHLSDSAVENAMEESYETGRVRPIAAKDYKRALKEVRPSTRPWFESARNYAMFQNEGGQYDELVEYLRAKRY